MGSDGTVYFGSYRNDNKTYAVNGDGTLKWTFLTGNGISSSPTVDGDVVYVGSSDGWLYALQGVNGALKWKVTTGRSDVTAPLVTEDTVVVASSTGGLHAHSKADGSPQWTYASGISQSSPSIAGDVIYFGTGDKYVHAVSS